MPWRILPEIYPCTHVKTYNTQNQCKYGSHLQMEADIHMRHLQTDKDMNICVQTNINSDVHMYIKHIQT